LAPDLQNAYPVLKYPHEMFNWPRIVAEKIDLTAEDAKDAEEWDLLALKPLRPSRPLRLNKSYSWGVSGNFVGIPQYPVAINPGDVGDAK